MKYKILTILIIFLIGTISYSQPIDVILNNQHIVISNFIGYCKEHNAVYVVDDKDEKYKIEFNDYDSCYKFNQYLKEKQ